MATGNEAEMQLSVNTKYRVWPNCYSKQTNQKIER